MNHKFSNPELCESCDHQACCTSFASPVVFSEDIRKLKRIGKASENYLDYTMIKGRTVKIIKKKKNSTHCIFWDEKKEQCSIYQSRPFDCQMFPFDIVAVGDKYHWVVYSCNPESNWQWSEKHLQKLEDDKSFSEIMENIDAFSDLTQIKTLKENQKIPMIVLREVRCKKSTPTQ